MGEEPIRIQEDVPAHRGGHGERRIARFGDGPASFNAEATKLGYDVTSLDPIYNFSRDQLMERIEQMRDVVMGQVHSNLENYEWTTIKRSG